MLDAWARSDRAEQMAVNSLEYPVGGSVALGPLLVKLMLEVISRS